MPVKNKKLYALYLDENETEYVKSFLETTKNKGGLSGLVDAHIKTLAITLRASGYKSGEKISVSQLIKIGIKGMMQEPL